jgi:3',5'-cyclic AMP phosphodiesterase CpdA
MSEALFRWIHISDIHFGHGDASHGWDQELVMAALRRDIAAMSVDLPVDAILVTGDIGFSGAGRSQDEYERAAGWLRGAGKAAGIGPERIYLVPGNHDVNRGVDARHKSAGRLLQALRSRGVPQQAVDEALRDAEDRKLLASRMEAYLELAKEFGPWAGRDPMPPAEQRLYWMHTEHTRGGLHMRLVGLNSALLSKDDEDLGQLRLGNEQLAYAFRQDRAANEVVIVLSHHPFRKGWLADEGHADAMLRANAHAHLSGHVHGAESEEARSGYGKSFVRVTAGAAHNDQLPPWIPQSHGYNYGEITSGEGGMVVLRVHPRLWSSGRFVVDVHSVPDGRTFAEHPLAVTLALPTYVSYAPADKQAMEGLLSRLLPLEQEGLIELYSKAEAKAGEPASVSAERLRAASVILVLLSADYLALDDGYDLEMKAALERHRRGEVRVLPILLRPCLFRATPFGQLPFALTPPGRSPSAVDDGESKTYDPFERIRDEVRAVVAQLRSNR